MHERGDHAKRRGKPFAFALAGIVRCAGCGKAHIRMSANGNGGPQRCDACTGRQPWLSLSERGSMLAAGPGCARGASAGDLCSHAVPLPLRALLRIHERGSRADFVDGPGRDRTCDLGIKSPLLYQLSYRPEK
jgi:hypothetical protein